MERLYSKAYAGIDVVASETKQVAAADVGRGTTLVAFYLDHHNMPLPTTQNAPLDKYASAPLFYFLFCVLHQISFFFWISNERRQ